MFSNSERTYINSEAESYDDKNDKKNRNKTQLWLHKQKQKQKTPKRGKVVFTINVCMQTERVFSETVMLLGFYYFDW